MGDEALRAETPREFAGEEDVGKLGLAIGAPLSQP